MVTKYYLKKDGTHLGNRSCGWKFTFALHPHLFQTWTLYLKFLSGETIVDEYDCEYTSEEFLEMATSWGGDDAKDLSGDLDKMWDGKRMYGTLGNHYGCYIDFW